MSMLASDLNNPEFAGAINPNAMISVEFYDFAAPDPWATREKGIKSFKPSCVFIKKSVPGRTDLTIERPATQTDASEFPGQWMKFQMESGRQPMGDNIPGWKIEDWPELNEEQVRQLKYLRFNTVEQIAGGNDTQIQGIGMGGPGLRLKAQSAIAQRNGQAVSEAVKERDEEIKGLKNTVSQMEAMMKQLMAAQGLKLPETPAETENPEALEFSSDPARETLGLPKRGPGRPPKEVQA